MMGMNITHTRIVTIPVSDQDRAKDFYVSILGFEVIIDQQAGPVRWLQVAPKDAQTAFTLATAEQGVTPGSAKGLILETTDLDADCADLKQAGVTVEGPTDLPWGCQATLTDPDGNSFVLAAPTPAGF
jgi:predicted enzyme related to lactoylglutathione lyase